MNNIRNLAILLLDDEHGINEAAFNEMLPNLDNDIVNVVECQNGRYFIGEDDAETLRTNPQVVPVEVAAQNYSPTDTPLGEQIEAGGELADA